MSNPYYDLKELAVSRPADLVFGSAPKPVNCGRGVEIGTGQVIPEINFTLPSMIIDETTWSDVLNEYREMIEGVCQRAVELRAPSMVVEFELLPPMTLNPQWGADITALLVKVLDGYHREHGLKSALRVTPVDVRDMARPPRMRACELLEKVLRSAELCAQAGADMLSIESTGGKELHDKALVQADLPGITLALGVLAVRDMAFLWAKLVDISKRHGIIAAGDTACGFANTAMVLAEKNMIPRTLAAMIRVASVVRSLEAYRQGSVGPSKDCAYEGPYLKALLGVPISMEGRTSACAHLSTVGNIAAACCDLWSNESIQNVRLLSTEAPVVAMEQLIYDCRLMNASAADGREGVARMQRWLVASDAGLDPQAYVLQPEVVVEIAAQLIKESDPLAMTLKAMEITLSVLREAHTMKRLILSEVELRWLGMMSVHLEAIPTEEEELWAQVRSRYGEDEVAWKEYL